MLIACLNFTVKSELHSLYNITKTNKLVDKNSCIKQTVFSTAMDFEFPFISENISRDGWSLT